MLQKTKLIKIGFLLSIILIINEFSLGLFLSSFGKIGNNHILFAIRIFDFYIFIIGILIFKSRSDSKLYSTFSFILLLLGVIIFTEIMLRSVLSIRYNFYLNSISQSEKLGWKTLENITLMGRPQGYTETIKFSTSEFGFRVFGDLNSTKKKVFVIGDSFTEGVNVNDSEPYYEYLDKTKYEVFAYGCGGYGTLQEHMILDVYYQMINPDLIILQFCSNDIVNNSYDLEIGNSKNNPHRIRPYLIDNKIKYLYPSMKKNIIYRIFDKIYVFRILKLQYLRFDDIESNYFSDNIEELEKSYKKSEEITLKIFDMIRIKADKVPIILFSTDYDEYKKDRIKSLFDRSGMIQIPNVPEQIINAKNNGIKVDGMPYDGHWNSNGHKIVGKYISSYIDSLNL